jgi:glycosyltransferase involved in cell wall biosynthesis
MLMQREAKLLERYEAETCNKFDHVVWVTEEDYNAVKHLNACPELVQSGAKEQRRIQTLKRSTFNRSNANSIIPICIDPSEISPVQYLTREPNILFLGGMHWPPNAEGVTWFLENVWHLIKEQVPGARVFIIGKSPPRITRRLECVEAPGFVEDVDPYWMHSRVFIVPLLSGGGMRVKILDAWARGLPVISTTIGAEGIEYSDNEDIMIADDPQNFANTIIRMLKDNILANKLVKNGMKMIENYYDWGKIYSAWDRIYQ